MTLYPGCWYSNSGISASSSPVNYFRTNPWVGIPFQVRKQLLCLCIRWAIVFSELWVGREAYRRDWKTWWFCLGGRSFSLYLLYKLLRFKVATVSRAWIVRVRYSFILSRGHVALDPPSTWEFWSGERILNSGLGCPCGQQGALLPFASHQGWKQPFQSIEGNLFVSHPYQPPYSVHIGVLQRAALLPGKSPGKAFGKLDNFKSKKQNISFILVDLCQMHGLDYPDERQILFNLLNYYTLNHPGVL